MATRLSQLTTYLIQYFLAYILWVILGFVFFVLSFQVNLFPGCEILFYKGILNAICVSSVVAVAMCTLFYIKFSLRKLLCPGFNFKDVFTISICIFALNVTFLIVLPVTIDRSVTVFLLGQMYETPNQPVTSQYLEERMRLRYIGELKAVERRMLEQMTSGNVTETPQGYMLTSQGRKFIELSGWIANLFNADKALVDPPPSQETQVTP